MMGGSTQTGGDGMGGVQHTKMGGCHGGGAAPTWGVPCHSPTREEMPGKGQVGSVLECSTELPRGIWGKMGDQGGMGGGSPTRSFGGKRVNGCRDPPPPPLPSCQSCSSSASAEPAGEEGVKRGGMYPPGVPRCPPHHVPGCFQLFQVSSSIPQVYILNSIPRCPPCPQVASIIPRYSQVFPKHVSLSCTQVSLRVPSQSTRVSSYPQVPPHVPGVSKCCQVSPCPQVSLSDFLPCPQVSPHVLVFPCPTHPKLSSSVPSYFQVSPRVHVPCVPGCPCIFPLFPPCHPET